MIPNKEEFLNQRDKLEVNSSFCLLPSALRAKPDNSEPVPPAERIYPQHLIGVAINFLEAEGIDWDEVRNVEELREQLNL